MKSTNTAKPTKTLSFVAIYDDTNIDKLLFYSGSSFTKDVETVLVDGLKQGKMLKVLSASFAKALDFFDDGADIATTMLRYTPFIPKLHRCIDDEVQALWLIEEMLEDMQAGHALLAEMLPSSR